MSGFLGTTIAIGAVLFILILIILLSGNKEEAAFKVLFGLAIAMFCVLIVGIFLLVVKIMFLFAPDFIFMGIKFSPSGL